VHSNSTVSSPVALVATQLFPSATGNQEAFTQNHVAQDPFSVGSLDSLVIHHILWCGFALVHTFNFATLVNGRGNHNKRKGIILMECQNIVDCSCMGSGLKVAAILKASVGSMRQRTTAAMLV
jgi:hypothetical protein